MTAAVLAQRPVEHLGNIQPNPLHNLPPQTVFLLSFDSKNSHFSSSAAADRQPSRRRRSSRCSRRERRDAPAAAAAPAVASGGGGGNTDDLTALKALDTMLRKYDRRSTPTNDQGKQEEHSVLPYIKTEADFCKLPRPPAGDEAPVTPLLQPGPLLHPEVPIHCIIS